MSEKANSAASQRMQVMQTSSVALSYLREEAALLLIDSDQQVSERPVKA